MKCQAYREGINCWEADPPCQCIVTPAACIMTNCPVYAKHKKEIQQAFQERNPRLMELKTISKR